MPKAFRESSNKGAMGWLWQRISAVVLFFLLIIHFVTYHFIQNGNISYDQIVSKMHTTWFNLVQMLFLVLALFHGFYGLWVIIEDYIHEKNCRIAIYSSIWIVGLVLLIVGVLTIIKASGIVLGVGL
jgi:succinate dehydrogenase / fumarate reductase, membrane anchor subunit